MKNKHWSVLIVCCGLAASSIGISINSSGVFYSPVSSSLNIMRGSFSMHMTIFSLSTAIASLFVAKIMKKVNYKLLLIISVITAVITTGSMSLVKTLFSFYILGALRGISTSMFSIVALTIIINNWFIKKHGLATSIVFGFSGLAGSIFSPILSRCIEAWGWQVGYIVKALIILGLCLPAILYPFEIDPKDEGLLPYGYNNDKELTNNNKQSFQFITVAFFSFFIFGMLFSCITSVTQHLPGYGQSLGFSITSSAMLLSAGMVGNIVSKLVIGSLSDYLGSLKATVFMIIINVIGILLLFTNQYYLLVLGAFLFGSCYSIGAVALPLLTKKFFGVDNYSKAFPIISFASNVGAAISLSMVGYIYDFFGSYRYAFIIALIMVAICIGLLFVVNKKRKY